MASRRSPAKRRGNEKWGRIKKREEDDDEISLTGPGGKRQRMDGRVDLNRKRKYDREIERRTRGSFFDFLDTLLSNQLGEGLAKIHSQQEWEKTRKKEGEKRVTSEYAKNFRLNGEESG